MKFKLLILLFFTFNIITANNTNKTIVGPSVGLIMNSVYTGGGQVFIYFRIKNTGDVPLTNIYIIDVSQAQGGGSPITIRSSPTSGMTINLAPGEENTYTFSGNTYSYGQCSVFNQAKVYATTPSSAIITDLSGYSYFDNNPTFTDTADNYNFSQEGVYQDLNNNSIVDVGDAINYTYSLTNAISENPFHSFTVSDNNAVIQNPNCINNNNWSSTGIHYITQTEANLGYVYNCPSIVFTSGCGYNRYYFYDPTPCTSCPNPGGCSNGTIITKITDLLPNNIIGNVKFNTNNDNCATGSNFPNRKIDVTDGSTTYSSYTNIGGNYNVYIPNTGNYTATVLNNLGANFTSNPSSTSVISTGENINYSSNYCVSSSANYTDLQVVLYPINSARPGFSSYYRIYYTNNGSATLNGTIQLAYDNGKQSFVNSTPTQNTTISNLLTWNYSNLLPFEYRYIDVTFNTFAPPTVNQGDNLSFTLTGNPIAGDNNSINNTFILNQTVVNSFDPNDKTVLEGATIQQSQTSEYLHYITRFQNTGTASATTVVLKETLDSDLDWTTLEPVGGSHNYNIQIKNGNNLTCTFSNIGLLNSSANEPASHGWFAYKIKPKSTFTIGNIASSDSKIYFDYNTPITTNTVTTQVGALSTNEFEKHSFKIYPNPATNNITFESTISNIGKYEISDVNGKLLLTGTIQSMKQVDISKLQNGLYFVTIKSENSKETFKIIKQ